MTLSQAFTSRTTVDPNKREELVVQGRTDDKPIPLELSVVVVASGNNNMHDAMKWRGHSTVHSSRCPAWA